MEICEWPLEYKGNSTCIGQKPWRVALQLTWQKK